MIITIDQLFPPVENRNDIQQKIYLLLRKTMSNPYSYTIEDVKKILLEVINNWASDIRTSNSKVTLSSGLEVGKEFAKVIQTLKQLEEEQKKEQQEIEKLQASFIHMLQDLTNPLKD